MNSYEIHKKRIPPPYWKVSDKLHIPNQKYPKIKEFRYDVAVELGLDIPKIRIGQEFEITKLTPLLRTFHGVDARRGGTEYFMFGKYRVIGIVDRSCKVVCEKLELADSWQNKSPLHSKKAFYYYLAAFSKVLCLLGGNSILAINGLVVSRLALITLMA